MTRSKQLVILLLSPPLAMAISFFLHANAFISVLLFLGVPTLIASYGLKRTIFYRAIVFTLICAPIAIITIDYIAELNGAWLFFPTSLFSFRLLHLVTVEVIVWAILNFYATVAFYERFFEHHRKVKVFEPGLKHLIYIITSLFALFLTAYIYTSGNIHAPYFYATFGTILILLPVALMLIRHRSLVKKFLLTGAYFFFVSLLYEITALRLGQWSFPSHQFIAWISFASVRFPLEEFLFWMVLFSMAVLSYYEHFADDNR